MKDLQYLLATKEIPSYSNDEIIDILTTEYNINGKNHQITVAMEEFAELIEVICENTIKGKVDMIHLKEELVDCWICMDFLSIIFDIKSLSPVTYYTRENCLNNCILNLSSSITKLSKCIREKSNAENKVISVVFTVIETLYNIQRYYELGCNDYEMKMIKMLKIERCQRRNENKMKSKDNLVLKTELTKEEKLLDTNENQTDKTK
jgi:hypothetical protein